MLFALKKFVSYFLMPLQFSVSLMLLGAALVVFTRRKRLGHGLVAAGIISLLVLSHKQVGLALLLPLETRYPAVPELVTGAPLPSELAACQAIVVLGGGHAETPGLSANNRLSTSATSRLMEGVRLARLLPEAQLVLCGPGLPGRPTHAAVLAAGAQALGIAADRLLLVTDVRDTEDEARQVRALLGDRPFALVTSAWHMPRTVALMQKAGLHPLPCPADFVARPNPGFRWNDWTCDLSGLERSTKAIYERLGLLWARWRGRA